MPRTGSILIIDNEPMIVDLLVELLTDEGYIAYSAPDNARALIFIADYQPALILLDIGYPNMYGITLIEELYRAGLATMPIMLMATMPYNVVPLLALGVVACLAKPFKFDEVLACVARYIQTTQAPPACYAVSSTAAKY